MTTAQREFERFLEWLPGQERTTDDVRRVAKLVFENFAAIEPTGVAQGQRSRLLAPILVARVAGSTTDLPEVRHENPAEDRPWVRLRQLIVGPFRGFQHPETFELDRRIVLVYGPNGTGKTSLCEALEYALIGEVAEAEAKRIPEETYLQNVHARAFAAPQLLGSSVAGQAVDIAPDRNSLQFCFIEKNRIDSFSRIAARTAGQRTELIASLFGLDGFTDFVRGFNNDLNAQLSFVDNHNQRLTLARAHLQGNQAILAGAQDDEVRFAAEENALAASLEEGLSFADLQARIGTTDAPGRLQVLSATLDIPQASEWGVTVQDLTAARESAASAYAERHALDEQLNVARTDVNFLALFEAVSGLANEITDRCPACDTPLQGDHSVIVNPFQKAQVGLATLGALAELQRQQARASDDLAQRSGTLRALVERTTLFARAQGDAGAFPFVDDLPLRPVGDWWSALDAQDAIAPAAWNRLLAVAHQAETRDLATREQAARRATLGAERDKLNDLNVQAAALRGRRTQFNERLNAARAAIAQFDEENQELLRQVEEERLLIAYQRRVAAAYALFLSLLRDYRAALPGKLTADLSDAALDLYNNFNRFDNEADRLAGLRLPATEEERIEIAFNSHPDEWVDALHVMSEGHIRCLGLSILMAKNIQSGCPVLIFDDAVNAIDNEHRLGIRDTLFDNEALAEKQILVTCHGEELIKDIEVVIGNRVANDQCISYTFLPHTGDRQIRVLSDSTRNYVLEAQQKFAAGRVREALTSARRAMESINDRTWSFLARIGHGELKLKLPRPRAPVDQNVLATAIKGTLDRPSFVHDRKERLLSGYSTMLGAREWGVLNPGVHEEAGIEDFDRATVERVIQNLAALDDTISGH